MSEQANEQIRNRLMQIFRHNASIYEQKEPRPRLGKIGGLKPLRKYKLAARHNPWLDYVKQIQLMHPNLQYKKVLELASKTYHKEGGYGVKGMKRGKHIMKKKGGCGGAYGASPLIIGGKKKSMKLKNPWVQYEKQNKGKYSRKGEKKQYHKAEAALMRKAGMGMVSGRGVIGGAMVGGKANKWTRFMKKYGGKGYTMEQLRMMYHQQK